MPDDLRARILEALVSAPVADVRDDPEAAAAHASRPGRRHDKHHFHIDCALCAGEAGTLADAVMAVVDAWTSEQAARRKPDPAFHAKDRVKVRHPGSLFDGSVGTVYRELDDGSRYPVVVVLDGRDDSRYFAVGELELLERPGGGVDA